MSASKPVDFAPRLVLWRAESDGRATPVGAWGRGDGPPIGSRPAEELADATPIVVDGAMWGALSAEGSEAAPLELSALADVVAAAITSSEAVRLADERAALRRVATLVVEGTTAETLFATVTEEVGRLFGTDSAGLIRYESDDAVTQLGNWNRDGDQADVELVRRFPIKGGSLSPAIRRTGRPARIDDWSKVPGEIAEFVRTKRRFTASVGAPIVVEGRVWGALFVHLKGGGPLPRETEGRLSGFADLVATAIGNTQTREDLHRLADEQAALRRVATLVAEGAPAETLFATVTEQVGRLFGTDAAAMIRYEGDDFMIVLGSWDRGLDHPTVPLGSRLPTEGGSLVPTIRRTTKPARIDDWSVIPGVIAEIVRTQRGFTSSVGVPILVEGRVWGVLMVHAKHGGLLPCETEDRLSRFADLVATAIVNAQTREDLRRLAEEQAALRRVATLVAGESPSPELFAAVAAEMGQLLGVEDVALMRYEDDATATVVSRWGKRDALLPVGSRMRVDGQSVTALVHRTSRPARIDDYTTATGEVGTRLQEVGVRAAAGCPVIVQGRLWGVMVAAQGIRVPLPPDTEARVGKFADLAATAIANAQARADLAASRARIVAATDQERRRVVRDLHDGAQQRLVHTLITLQLAQRALPAGGDRASGFLGDAVAQTELAIRELRELAHGILPAVLTRGGLRAGARTLAQRSQIPIDVTVEVQRLPATIEATAYFVIAEALTNVAKHADATRVTVLAHVVDGTLRVEIRDDGVGGAQLDGAGLRGLTDRLAALEGRLWLDSPPGDGTLVAAEIPLQDAD